MSDTEIRELVRSRYAAAAEALNGTGTDPLTVLDAGCCSAGSCAPEAIDVDPVFGAGLYSADEHGELPAAAVAASLGCGNPTAVADLRPGETVLDLGSGGGIDVLLSARRVGPTGFAYGVDTGGQRIPRAGRHRRARRVDRVHQSLELPGVARWLPLRVSQRFGELGELQVDELRLGGNHPSARCVRGDS